MKVARKIKSNTHKTYKNTLNATPVVTTSKLCEDNHTDYFTDKNYNKYQDQLFCSGMLFNSCKPDSYIREGHALNTINIWLNRLAQWLEKNTGQKMENEE
jgi:hypothetical protein